VQSLKLGHIPCYPRAQTLVLEFQTHAALLDAKNLEPNRNRIKIQKNESLGIENS
jgi:hypothetical protein